MGVYNYYPKGSTSSQTFGIATYVPTTIKAMIVVGHGLGECGDGGLSILTTISKWGDSWNGGWKDLKLNADKYGIVLVWMNTSSTSKYSSGEIEFALDWGLSKFASKGITESNSFYLGHSLGWYGAGRYFFNSLTRAKRFAGTFASASGPYGSGWTEAQITALMQNLVDAGLKIWGVTATNDTTSGTDPKWVRYLYDRVKAISASAHTIVSEFPSGTWSSSSAHNAVLTKLTRSPIEVTPTITRGITTGLPIKMDIYQWMLSNPRGSIYQDPTLFYSGPKYADVTIVDVNYSITKGLALIKWSNGEFTTVKAATGDSILNFYHRLDSLKRQKVTVDYNIAPSVDYGPLK